MSTEPKVSDALRQMLGMHSIVAQVSELEQQIASQSQELKRLERIIAIAACPAREINLELERLRSRIATQAKGAEEASALMQGMEAELNELRKAFSGQGAALKAALASWRPVAAERDRLRKEAKAPCYCCRESGCQNGCKCYEDADAALHPTEPVKEKENHV
jgi:regulator of replication initiation timing